MAKISKYRFYAGSFLVVCCAFVFGAIVCYAEYDKPREGKGKFGLFKDLNLSAEQEAALAEYKKNEIPEMKDAREALVKSRVQLMEELGKPVSDAKEVDRLAAEVKGYQGKMLDFHIRSIFYTKEILTSEQFQQFIEKIKEKRGDRKSGKFGDGRRKMMDGPKECAHDKEKEQGLL